VFDVVNRTKKFDLSKDKDLAEYDLILNDPTCLVIREVKEKLTEKEEDGEGNTIHFREYLLLIVTYQKRTMML